MSGDRADGAGASVPLPLRNRLLAVLSPEDLAQIEPHLELVDLSQRDVLFEPGRQINHVFFPETAVLSLVNTMQEGGTVEVGTVGLEGVAGLGILLGDDISVVRAIAQIPGTARRIDVAAFQRLAAPSGALYPLLLRYVQAFLTQVAQTAACNAAHLVEQRCSRWLLMTRDRVDGASFPLTQEFLAFMLGVRRAGVTTAMRGLQHRGHIRYTRGRVKIVDRDGLEAASCECYRVVRAHFDRLLPVPSRGADGEGGLAQE